MALTSDDVGRLAALARIELSQEELAHLAPQIDLIVDAVAGVAEVMAVDIPPTSHSVVMTNVMRQDVTTSLDQPMMLPLLEADAPAWEDDRFRVPRILEEES